MFERFTDRARRVVVLAQEEARLLEHNFIGTEHLLLGLIRVGEGVAAEALEALGVSLETVRVRVRQIVGQGESAPTGHIPFTPRAKKVLELSLREALQLGHNYIGTEHLLLGMVREGEGVAAQILIAEGVQLNQLRRQVITILGGSARERMPVSDVEAGSAPLLRPVAMYRSSGRPGGPIERTPLGPPAAWPSCPRCGRDLREGAAYRALSVEERDGGGGREILFVFCRECGETLGAIENPEPRS